MLYSLGFIVHFTHFFIGQCNFLIGILALMETSCLALQKFRRMKAYIDF